MPSEWLIFVAGIYPSGYIPHPIVIPNMTTHRGQIEKHLYHDATAVIAHHDASLEKLSSPKLPRQHP